MRYQRAKWNDLVPYCVANKQVQWECCQQVLRAREAGLTLDSIAYAMMESKKQVRQRLRRAEKAGRSPVENFLFLDRFDLQKLSQMKMAPPVQGGETQWL